MSLASNPYVKAELDNLQIQFGPKALLDLDDYRSLFGIGREKASRHAKERNMPRIKIGKVVYFPIIDMAVYLARIKAEQEGRIIVPKDNAKNRSGFARKAHEAQLTGGRK